MIVCKAFAVGCWRCKETAVKKKIEFFLDVGSPTTYLAWKQMPGVAARSGADVVLRPFLLGGVFKATGNASPITVPAKGAFVLRDIQRHAQQLGLPFKLNPHFPMNTLMAMRCAVGCASGAEMQRYFDLVFDAVWEQGKNIAEEAELRSVLIQGGMDADLVLSRAQRPEVKQALIQNTEEAVKRGAFGAPTFFVDDELFFGQDRLLMVEQYARAA
jgi:2-hydroxychromene-2-carboxylate isomerase